MIKKISADKIIKVIERADTETPEPCFKIIKENKKFCPHAHLNIFRHHRQVFCTDCGAKLDAFDALLSMAAKDNNCVEEMQRRKYELQRLKAEKDKLEGDIKKYERLKRAP